MAKQPTKAELIERVARLESELGAFQEWFWACHKQPTDAIDVPVTMGPDHDSHEAVITIRGARTRLSGGTAVVAHTGPLGGFVESPVYASNLIDMMRRSAYLNDKIAADTLYARWREACTESTTSAQTG